MFGFCENINASFSTWTPCLGEAFFGDPVLISIGIMAMIAYVAYKLNLPHEASLAIGIGWIIMMAIIFSSPAFYALLAITVLIVTVYLVRGAIKPAKR